jgi:hypothetical protein
VVEVDPLAMLVEPVEVVDTVETPCPAVVEALDNPLGLIPDVKVLPVTPAAVVVVDVKTVVPTTFHKVKYTNSYRINESTHLLCFLYKL